MKNLAPKLLSLLAFGFGCTIATAQVTVANYTFAGGVRTSSVSVAGLSAGNVSSPQTYFGYSSALGQAYVFPTTVVNAPGGTPAYSTTAADAVANDRYFEFTVTPTSGNQVSLATLSFNYGAVTSTGALPQAGAPITPMFQVRSSVDNFSTSIGDTTAFVFGQSTSDVSKSFSVSLSSLGGFSQLTTTTTFRIYGYFGTGTPGYGDSLRLDNVNLTGTVAAAVPEPSSAALGAGALALFGSVATIRRRKRI